MGLAENSLATKWGPRDGVNGSSALGEAGREQAFPPRIAGEPGCRQSLGVSAPAGGLETPAVNAPYVLILKGMLSMAMFPAASDWGFCFGGHKSEPEKVGNPENPIDCARWI